MEGTAKAAPAASKSGKNKKVLAILVVAVLIVAAVGAALLLGMGESKTPKVFRYGTIDGNHESLDPAVDYETVGGEILQNVYETLVFYNGNSSSDLKPMLAAELPEISEDGKIYNFTLREGVKFSNGKTMTAEDVKYSFDRGLLLNDPHGPFWMYGAVLIPDYYDYGMATFDSAGNMEEGDGVITQAMCDAAIWAKSTYEIQFNLTEPYAPFLSALAFNAASVVSKAYVEDNGGLTQAGYDHMASNTMGTGPYMLDEFKSGEYYKLVANKNYWRGAPNIDIVMIKQFKDTSARILALKNGDLDAAYVPRDLIDTVEGHENLTIVKGFPTFNIDFLGLNQEINLTNADPNVINVPSDFFADKNVRLAFMHAFDYQKYINETMQGMAIQPNGAIPKGMFGYSADVPTYNFDLDLARSYLENAETNWVEQGFKLEVYYNSGNEARQTACMLIKDGLEELSDKIEVSVKPLEWSVYLDYRKDGQMPAMFLGWAPDYADPDNYLQPFYHSGGTYASMIGYENKTLDAAITAAALEQDPEVRAQMYEDLMFDMYEEALFAWTAQATNFFVCQDYVEGYYFNPMFSNLYYYDLDIPESVGQEEA